MSDFKSGEVVDITIKGARVQSVSNDHWLAFWITDRGTMHSLDISAPGVTVERVAPAEWPPQAGDVWLDRAGEPWFAFSDHDVLLLPAFPVSTSRAGLLPRVVMEKVGPLTLVRREDRS